MSVFPGVAITVNVLGLNLLGDAINGLLNKRRPVVPAPSLLRCRTPSERSREFGRTGEQMLKRPIPTWAGRSLPVCCPRFQ